MKESIICLVPIGEALPKYTYVAILIIGRSVIIESGRSAFSFQTINKNPEISNRRGLDCDRSRKEAIHEQMADS